MSRFKKLTLTAITLFLLTLALAWEITPTPSQITRAALGSDQILLGRDGEVLQTLRTDFNKRRLAWYPLRNFPKYIEESVIAAEDHRFRYHFGFDPIGLGRALWADAQRKPVQGASTITMQLGDLIQDDVLLHNATIRKGSFVHKGIQILRALGLEMRWSKNEILEAYLNLIHLRGEFQGVPALTYAYLGKAPLGLEESEAAVIATMISSPNQSADSLKRKACTLYHQAHREESCAAIASAVTRFFARSPSLPVGPAFAPHLARRLFNENPAQSILKSSLDSDLQQKVIAILEKNLYRLRAANVHDSAAIVMDNKTGQVLAYVGAVSTSESPHVDGVMAYRQAGSSLKPFLYGKALETQTLTIASILLDDPTAISWGGDVYRPSNYDRHFYGPVTVREALGSSLNVPAVKTVVILGLHQTYQTLQSIGLTGLKEPDFYGVSMALGAVEVRLEELANAYRMLANGGEWSPAHYTEKTSTQDQPHRVYSPEAAFLIGNILSDPNARAIGFGWENPLETPFWSAVKTGTSKDYRDNWCVGFSERYTVGVWAGNFNAEAMQKVSGVSGVGPSWFEIMNYLHRREPSHAPQVPAGVIAKTIRHQWAGQARQEYFIKGTEPAREVIELAPDKRVQFVFPAEGSVLVKDPQMDQSHVALFVRFKGQIPEQSQLLWDGKALGKAVSPFKLEQPQTGHHDLSIIAADGKLLSKVQFTIKGAETAPSMN